jgi:hypothetical protein
MDRNIFRRGVRMTHEFGGLEEMKDPTGRETFNPPFPVETAQQHSRPITTQQYGVHQLPWNEPKEGVQKPNGQMASFNGPAPDLEACGITVSIGGISKSTPIKNHKRRSGDY